MRARTLKYQACARACAPSARVHESGRHSRARAGDAGRRAEFFLRPIRLGAMCAGLAPASPRLVSNGPAQRGVSLFWRGRRRRAGRSAKALPDIFRAFHHAGYVAMRPGNAARGVRASRRFRPEPSSDTATMPGLGSNIALVTLNRRDFVLDQLGPTALGRRRCAQYKCGRGLSDKFSRFAWNCCAGSG